jgi:hypothetical protein
VEKARGNLGGDTGEVAERKRKSQRTTRRRRAFNGVLYRRSNCAYRSVLLRRQRPRSPPADVFGRSRKSHTARCTPVPKSQPADIVISPQRERGVAARDRTDSLGHLPFADRRTSRRGLFPRDFPPTWCHHDLYILIYIYIYIYVYAIGRAGSALSRSKSSLTVLHSLLESSVADRRTDARGIALGPPSSSVLYRFSNCAPLTGHSLEFSLSLLRARARVLRADAIRREKGVRGIPCLRSRPSARGFKKEDHRRIGASDSRPARFDVPAAAPSHSLFLFLTLSLSLYIYIPLCLSLPLATRYVASLPARALPKASTMH